MRKRKSTGKKLRFEVFKRDKFCCQYCGKKAPDVVLVCDHVSPVALGGETTILNLITACVECNAGKGARPLDDSTVLAKQRAELELLAERREQIDMMLEWSRGLGDLKKYECDTLISRAAELFVPFTINELGTSDAKKWLRNFALSDLLEALEISATQYIKFEENGKPTNESVSLAWSKVPGIARLSKLPADERGLYYIRGILRNRLNYIGEHECISLLREVLAAGYEIDSLKQHAREVRNWAQWRDHMNDMLEEAKSARP